MIKKLLVPIILLLACEQQSSSEELPYLGNTIYEEHDTIYHKIQDFQLVDQDSSIVTNETFADQVYVADFFFTSCPTICPMMKAQMLRVYEKFEANPEVAILSHTIDPTYDTVALLKDYAERLGVSSDKWKFVTGGQDYIYDLAEKSYISLADEDSNAPGGFVHSGAFLLVDKNRHVRGFYDGTVPEQVDVLMNDINRLLKEYKDDK
ncbi:protein SCO1/2 [Ekhidna lutea]|uniref:Protein SCO1/2 n=1 Tax=Ekhidna lutea TaxID=447679 RepID=A0A239KDE7_EKHLU|nr:SCO family protein [Ekhidna lutea]SNT16396.1 protein SCO1/2 [Ekhidna lutea]